MHDTRQVSDRIRADGEAMKAREPVVLSWSGGKDSALALDALRRDETVEVVALLTTVTGVYDRISIHGVRRELLRAQARAAKLPLHEMVIPPACTNAEYEAALAGALEDVRASHPDVRRIAYGDLFLADVRQYREERLRAHGFEGLFPLWGRSTEQLARELVHRGFEARLVCVDTTVLDARFAGRLFDDDFLRDLPSTIDPCGERGEFHTYVAAGPIFEAPIPYELGEVVLRDERFAYCDLLPGT
jgi:uncharacterized protein (TIGR00290 family)